MNSRLLSVLRETSFHWLFIGLCLLKWVSKANNLEKSMSKIYDDILSPTSSFFLFEENKTQLVSKYLYLE